MIYLGPEKKFKAKKKDKKTGRIIYFDCDVRILYADTYNEMINIISKINGVNEFQCSKDYIKRHYNYLSCKLFKRHSWKPGYLMRKGFIEFKELTLMQETEFINNKFKELQEQKALRLSVPMALSAFAGEKNAKD